MKAAIYARYSSENQRPESITDQVESCRRLATVRGYDVATEHVFSDEASSGARSDRSGLSALRAAAELGAFQVVLVDDLSRLARNTLLMLSILEELRFHGIRVSGVNKKYRLTTTRNTGSGSPDSMIRRSTAAASGGASLGLLSPERK